MEKGKYGIRLSFYAVAAFILVILGGYTIPLFLLAGAVIFVEKDEWASRQVIEAICLQVVVGIVNAFFDLFSFIYKIPFVGTAWGTIISVIDTLVSIAILVFAIIALIKVAKGKEAGIPLADKFANWAYGKIVVQPQPVVYAQPVQPAQPMQQAQPVQPVQPVQQAAPAADVCAKCGEPLNGAAFCTKCGTPAAR